jgi:hypothetical protein
MDTNQARLDRIATIIEAVDNRAQCGACVRTTLETMTQQEISAIYALSKGHDETWVPGL